MKRVVFAAVLACCIGGSASGQMPSFGQYPAKAEAAKAKTIDFRNSPGASAFRTRLRDGLRRGVNFAGHFIIVGWGCGTGCVSGGIIDARDGRVYFPKEFNALAVAYDDSGYKEPIEYRKNSRLLILNGIPGTANDDDPQSESGTYYFEWRSGRFRLIKFVRSEN